MILANATIVNDEFQLMNCDIRIDGERIVEIGTHLFGEEIWDMSGTYILPGFIDTHIHGSFGVEFYTCEHSGNLKTSLDYLSSQGVTSVLVTLAAESNEEYVSDCDRILEANDDRILGIHCEGPMVNFNRKGGLQPDKLQTPNLDVIDVFENHCKGMLKIFSMAPELQGADDVIKYLSNKGVKVSMAHSDATYEEATHGVDMGCTRITHLYNAMRPLAHRDPGIIGCALTDDRVECELICDMHHVAAPAIKLAVSSKGIDKITMISDTSFFCGMPDGKYIIAGREINVSQGFARLSDGTIRGSACSLAVGAKNMFDLGYNPEEIAVMACVNPARAAGTKDRGELIPGYRADVIILDKKFNVKAVFLKGEKIKG